MVMDTSSMRMMATKDDDIQDDDDDSLTSDDGNDDYHVMLTTHVNVYGMTMRGMTCVSRVQCMIMQGLSLRDDDGDTEPRS